MTGMRPDTAGVHGNHVHFRKRHPDVRTLPQWFREQGYHTQSMGKIYHGVFPPGSSITVADTFGDAPSWSVPTFRPGPRYYYTEAGIQAARQVYQRIYKPEHPGPDDWTNKLVFGPATEAPPVADNVLYDGQVAERAVATLRDLAGGKAPFFLAVGFIKPHSPYIAPKKYWDLYDSADIELADDEKVVGAPAYARHGSGELRRYTDQPRRGVIPSANQRRVRHAYLACTSYIDAQLGTVLDELDRLKLADNTVVVIWSDHGYHLGEVGLWGKTTNRELDTRVVLMARSPKAKARGKACEALVEFVDVYPTLVELCGLPMPAHVEGTSFAPLLDDPQLAWKRAAFSQFTRGKRRGYSIRSKDYRYTEWFETKGKKRIARVLYDHRLDPRELHNVVGRDGYQATVERLAKVLDGGQGWRAVAAAVKK
jgi:arylsulfatase A-like enzyme